MLYNNLPNRAGTTRSLSAMRAPVPRRGGGGGAPPPPHSIERAWSPEREVGGPVISRRVSEAAWVIRGGFCWKRAERKRQLEAEQTARELLLLRTPPATTTEPLPPLPTPRPTRASEQAREGESIARPDDGDISDLIVYVDNSSRKGRGS